MNAVRPFRESDVPQVAALHRMVFRADAPASNGWLDAYRTYFADVFLNPAVCDGAPASLVYERDGSIRGFLGVMPRRMLFKGRPIRMAVCSQFMVDPLERGQIGLRMLKQCFAGSQDLSITDEAADRTRRVWEWCGGSAVLPYSIQWIRPLRPARALVALVAVRRGFRRPARAAVPAARLVDAALDKFARGPFRLEPAAGSREAIDGEAFLACVSGVATDHALRPWYDARTAAWAVERASVRPGHGALRKILIRDEHNAIAGWCCYSVSRDGVGQVLQIAARAHQSALVVGHLLEDALAQGAIALCGRMDSGLAAELSDAGFLLHRRGPWTLVHSTNADLLAALHRGDALLTRLEGEWCLRFP